MGQTMFWILVKQESRFELKRGTQQYEKGLYKMMDCIRPRLSDEHETVIVIVLAVA